MKRDAGRKCVFKRGTIALGGKKNGERRREREGTEGVEHKNRKVTRTSRRKNLV